MRKKSFLFIGLFIFAISIFIASTASADEYSQYSALKIDQGSGNNNWNVYIDSSKIGDIVPGQKLPVWTSLNDPNWSTPIYITDSNNDGLYEFENFSKMVMDAIAYRNANRGYDWMQTYGEFYMYFGFGSNETKKYDPYYFDRFESDPAFPSGSDDVRILKLDSNWQISGVVNPDFQLPYERPFIYRLERNRPFALYPGNTTTIGYDIYVDGKDIVRVEVWYKGDWLMDATSSDVTGNHWSVNIDVKNKKTLGWEDDEIVFYVFNKETSDFYDILKIEWAKYHKIDDKDLYLLQSMIGTWGTHAVVP